jgi:hypothetical protein
VIVAKNATQETIDVMDGHQKIDVVSDSATREATASADLRHIHEEIQAYRKKRDWGRVAALYKRLIQSAPGSETAVVSRVSLGEIYLTKLHQYKSALVHFDRYLRSGHTALLPEAFYGKCNALKALGNRDGEVRCLARFIKQFNGAFQVPDARARLDALRGQDKN